MRRYYLLTLVLLLIACDATSDRAPPVTSSSSSSVNSAANEQVTIIADHLSIPWDIAFLPSGELLVTERPGTLIRLGDDQVRHTIAGVRHIGEGGLLGIAIHPDFSDNHWIYLYLTTGTDGLSNRIERYRLEDDTLTERTDILTGIPGSQYHDGGRIDFGPDGYLYSTTGDAGNSTAAQQTDSLAGKILRIKDDGSIPPDNPFGNAVYSYGHRNPQGLAWDDAGRLFATEHGRSGALSGFDELNLIEKGQNYGWPVIQGSETKDGMRSPILHSGSSDTWAPASALFYNGSIFFGGLKGEAIYEVKIFDQNPVLQTHFKNTYGRIRSIRKGPDNYFYITTSNTDGRGSPTDNDDRIIRIAPSLLQ